VVDKYIGDAVMAFWGSPVPSSHHAREAVIAALEMKRACDELRDQWKQKFGHMIYARAGINTGTAVVGNMGSKHKYNYTVMGDMVNLASRLEGANKAYGTDLMISESTLRACEDAVEVRELDSIAVKGKVEPVRVFEVLAMKGELTAGELDFARAFERGLEKYRGQEFAAAIEEFENTLRLRTDDQAAPRFIERCRHFMEEPPAPDWDGVWRMKEK
jgi:adenylate cyclase